VALRLRINRWQGEERLQTSTGGLRPSGGGEVVLQRRERTYWCAAMGNDLLIRRNEAGRIALRQLQQRQSKTPTPDFRTCSTRRLWTRLAGLTLRARPRR